MQIFGADGQMWFDTNDRAGKVMGDLRVSGNTSVLVGMGGMGQPFAILPSTYWDSWQDQNGNQFSAPTMGFMNFSRPGAVDGDYLNINFTFATTSNPNAYLFYGCF
ncbi:hypothetical protein [Stenotrophomonas sp. 24(2023)]|uniref:hypothetical protein n=1 Tax=Stenotrophomonas sp. 24(2023) TaxID=3068324 RepID=UPI0027E19B72|nr:hypothetical protein [Stenotrophomonas sp. 24(2023)]WMJ71322.1 hypothetical protein Q9R17_09570 [Stenotrophomonas sp. 24(2023)]